jgi:hypothetical protein
MEGVRNEIEVSKRRSNVRQGLKFRSDARIANKWGFESESPGSDDGRGFFECAVITAFLGLCFSGFEEIGEPERTSPIIITAHSNIVGGLNVTVGNRLQRVVQNLWWNIRRI